MEKIPMMPKNTNMQRTSMEALMASSEVS